MPLPEPRPPVRSWVRNDVEKAARFEAAAASPRTPGAATTDAGSSPTDGDG